MVPILMPVLMLLMKLTGLFGHSFPELRVNKGLKRQGT